MEANQLAGASRHVRDPRVPFLGGKSTCRITPNWGGSAPSRPPSTRGRMVFSSAASAFCSGMNGSKCIFQKTFTATDEAIPAASPQHNGPPRQRPYDNRLGRRGGIGFHSGRRHGGGSEGRSVCEEYSRASIATEMARDSRNSLRYAHANNARARDAKSGFKTLLPDRSAWPPFEVLVPATGF